MLSTDLEEPWELWPGVVFGPGVRRLRQYFEGGDGLCALSEGGSDAVATRVAAANHHDVEAARRYRLGIHLVPCKAITKKVNLNGVKETRRVVFWSRPFTQGFSDCALLLREEQPASG